MSFVSASQPAPGKRPGKQNRPYFGLWGSPVAPSANLRPGARPFPSQASSAGGKSGFGDCIHAEGSRKPATSCFLLLPPCFPGFRARVGEAKTAPKGRS